MAPRSMASCHRPGGRSHSAASRATASGSGSWAGRTTTSRVTVRSRSSRTCSLNRTITIDFQNEATYFQLLGDGKAFLECVLAFVLALGFQLKHKATCHGGGCLTRHSHYVRV